MKTLVLMIAVLATIFVIGSVAAQTVENDDTTPIRLYFHSDGSDTQYNMSSMGPGSGDGTQIQADDVRDYVLNQTLKFDLFVIGDDLGGGQKGFKVNLEVDCDSTLGGDTEAQLQIVNESDDSIVAESAWLSSQTNWSVPFVDGGIDNYTFVMDSQIIVRIKVRTDDAIAGWANIDTIGDYYLQVICSPIELRMSAELYDYSSHKWWLSPPEMEEVSEEEDEFQPNIPSNLRFMNVTGEVRSAFGSYDVRHVTLSLFEGNGEGTEIVMDELTVHENEYQGSDIYKFYHIWWWNIKDIVATDTANNADDYRWYPTYTNPDGIEFRSIYGSATFDMLEYAVFMEFQDGNQTTYTTGELGNETSVHFTVHNTGMSNEQIDLEANSIKDWNITLDKTTFSLSEGGSTEVTATIEIPGDASVHDTDTAQVEATIDENLAFRETVNIEIEATGSIKFEFINTGNLSETVGPGETATYGFRVTNEGSEPESFDLRNDALDSGWTITYDPSSSKDELDDGSSWEVDVKIKAPSQVTASTVLVEEINIYAWPEGRSDLEQRLLTTTTLQDYDIIQDITPETGISEVEETDPDFEYSQVTFDIEAYNGEVETVEASFEIDYDASNIDGSEWLIIEPDDADIEADETEIFTYLFTPMKDIEPGSYHVEFIVLFDDDGKSESGDLFIEVEEYIEIAAVTVSEDSVKVDAEDRVTFQFDLVNNGNADDVFEVRISGVDSEWDVWIDGVSSATNTKDIDLDQGDEKTVTIEFVSPEQAEGETFDITVTVQSENDPSYEESLSFTIKVEEKSDDPTGPEILERMLPLIALVFVLIIIFAMFKRKSRKMENQ